MLFYCALLLFLVSATYSTLTCPSGKVYVKFIKKTTTWGYEESWKVFSDSTTLYTSPSLQNDDLRVIEECITTSPSNQYTLKMMDSAGDSWSAGAYLSVQGIYGNIFFKNYMSANYDEEHSLSLYYAFMKEEEWKFTSGSVTGDWTQLSYADSTWNDIIAGSVTSVYTGTQYFRKQFIGITGKAAYEASLHYRYGIVVYINGLEVYRDNMPEGTISSTTLATGGYSAYGYHSFIRPGPEVHNGQNMIAVELHFLNEESNDVELDAFLAIMATTAIGENCYIYPYNTTLSSTDGSDLDSMFDFDKTSYYSVSASSLPSTITMSFDGPRPYLNSIRIWPYTSISSAPSAITLQGSFSSSWVNVVMANNLVYENNVFKKLEGYFNSAVYTNYRLQLISTSASTLRAYEIQPTICSITVPTTIEFEPATYTFYSRYESVFVQPKLKEFTNCQILPELAPGLSFDSQSCTLTGIVTSALPQTTYSVASVMNNVTYVGTFQLQITECSGTVVNVNRIYKGSASRESFDIREASTQTVILAVQANSGQVNNSEDNTILCLTSSKYTVTIGSTSSYWQEGSFLTIKSLLAGNEDTETILRVKFDDYIGLQTTYTFNAQLSIQPVSEWYYKHGTVPTNWYDSSVSDWQTGTPGSIPQSTNQIQMYKKTFSVSSLTGYTGLVISLKYQYGVIVYLNSHEVFRKGVAGTLSTSSFASTSLTEVGYHQISLPLRTIAIGSSTPVNYIQQGTNVIAIALVAMNPTQLTSTFDCTLRLMAENSIHRGFDYTITSSELSGSPNEILDQHYSSTISSSTCSDNSIDITFNDDRHEWISSIVMKLHYTQTDQHPKQFVVKAKNTEDTEWTVLKTVTGLSWSLAGQKNRIWIPNNTAYGQYRLENIGTGDSTSCAWKFNTIDLVLDDTTVTVPELTYTATSIFKDIEMGEVYPSSSLYTDFSITPALPSGVILDSHTGIISGTAHAVTSSQTFTITAKKFNSGESVSVPFSLTVQVCYGGKSLITMVVRTDSSPAQSSYKLFKGKSTMGSPLHSVDEFYVSNALVYGDFCLEHDIYTLQLLDTSIGWNTPAGYYLTVDVGEMKFEMGQVYQLPMPAAVTTRFSSLLPFQIEYDDWKVSKHAVSTNWNTLDYDDSAWAVVKAADIGTSEMVTVYIRKDITIPSVEDYQVLNVRVKYSGGIVAYFNGRKVARFNIEEEFDSNTESISIHDENAFSRFHIILPTVGAVVGKNCIAFEIHRPKEQSSAVPVVFDATGIFGVNACSLCVDTVIDVTGTASTIGDLENYFDYTPVTNGYQANAVGTYLQWTVENLEGTKFNSFAMETTNVRNSWGFSLYGRLMHTEDEEPTSMYSGVNLSVLTRGRTAWDVPVGIAGFRQFRHEVDDTASSNIIASAFIFQYCKAETAGFCPGVDDFPSVAEGQISPGPCGDGYRGYAYRMCTDGILSSIQMDKCTYKVPAGMLYPQSHYSLVVDTESLIDAPVYQNIITNFYLDDNIILPQGLSLNVESGVISGKVTEVFDARTYTVYGENPVGVTSTTITISARKGECKADGNFPKVVVGETAVFECSSQGLYLGSQKRECVLGTRDGEWQEATGMCIPIVLLIIILCVVIVIVACIVLVACKTSKKKKAVGGVRGKKAAAVESAGKKSVKV